MQTEPIDPPKKSWVTVLIVFFAFVSALATLMMSRSFNRTLLTKAEAAILESRIADQWSYYQAKNVRKDIVKLAQAITKNKQIKLEDFEDPDSLDSKREAIYTNARILEARRDELNRKSERLGKVAHNFATSVALLQISLMTVGLHLIRPAKNTLYFGFGMGLLGTLVFGASLAGFIRVQGWSF